MNSNLPRNFGQKLSKNSEIFPQNLNDLILSQSAKSLVRSFEEREERFSSTALTCSQKRSNNTGSTVSKMVLSQRPLQVRSPYYSGYQRTSFDDLYANCQVGFVKFSCR